MSLLFTPSRGDVFDNPTRILQLTGFLFIAMHLVASLLSEEVQVLHSDLIAYGLYLAVQAALVLALITAAHASRSLIADREPTPWKRSYARALEALGSAYVGVLMTGFGLYAVLVKEDDRSYLIISAIGLLFTLGCLVWMVRSVRQRP